MGSGRVFGNFPAPVADHCHELPCKVGIHHRDGKSRILSHTPVEEHVEPDAAGASVSGEEVRDQLRVSAWARFRPLVMRLHFYAGLFVAPFVLVAACPLFGLSLAAFLAVDVALGWWKTQAPGGRVITDGS